MDPYNELDHQRPSHMSETEYVSQMLTKIKRFAQHHDVHVWFVAHPRQLRDWKGQPPTMYDISGSAHFINKADNGLVIHRNRDPEAGPMNEVRTPCVMSYCWQCKLYPNCGSIEDGIHQSYHAYDMLLIASHASCKLASTLRASLHDFMCSPFAHCKKFTV